MGAGSRCGRCARDRVNLGPHSAETREQVRADEASGSGEENFAAGEVEDLGFHAGWELSTCPYPQLSES